MIKLVKIGNEYSSPQHMEYIIDSADDVASLPGITQCSAGSIAQCADGITYVMTPSGDWAVQNVASGSGGVKSVNNKTPDENGNITIATGTPEEYSNLIDDVENIKADFESLDNFTQMFAEAVSIGLESYGIDRHSGIPGQVLTRVDSEDFYAKWQDAPSGVQKVNEDGTMTEAELWKLPSGLYDIVENVIVETNNDHEYVSGITAVYNTSYSSTLFELYNLRQVYRYPGSKFATEIVNTTVFNDQLDWYDERITSIEAELTGISALEADISGVIG